LQQPGDLSAIHFLADGHMCAAEFHRGSEGWSLHQAAQPNQRYFQGETGREQGSEMIVK